MLSVEGHKHLYRDEKSGAIVNYDTQGYQQYLQLKNKKLNEQEEIKRLRSDIDEIKSLLHEVLNKRL
tara:strand:- start:125 stop:325 length:201 start_codon:yes stop_codon:yes gene_type:complete